MMDRKNLNKITYRKTDAFNTDPHDLDQSDHSRVVTNVEKLEVFFKSLDAHLIEKISEADAVVGCVAWLTHQGILSQLASVPHGVSIIVQKEDFLRPDKQSESDYHARLHRQYLSLNPISGPNDAQIERVSSSLLSGNKESWVDISVRCVGFAKQPNELVLPRMHHKFLVFCKYHDDFENYWNYYPYAVWTGSFNMTHNGTQSIENAVYIEDKKIAKAYFSEWFNMLLISENLDWTRKYCDPDIQMNDLTCIS